MRMRSFIAVVLLVSFILPVGAKAAPEASFEVSGWIPYWEVSKGTKSARTNIDSLDAIQPFSFSVQPDGSIKDLAGMNKSAYKRLIKEAKSEGVRITPTVMWSDTVAIHRILSDSTLRASHVKAIADMVKKGKYDGVDIDYEGKRAETKQYFSLFLKELDAALDIGFLACTIEARTPPESLYTTIPATLQYANDYVEINKYCDRVYVMAYDQQRADLKLNAARTGQPYYPVADIDWVRKVMTLTAQTIDKKKLVIGIPTYGREVEVVVSPNWFQSYRQLWSVNGDYPEDTADDYDVEIGRTKGGEPVLTYISKDSKTSIPRSIKAPAGTPKGMETAARALAYANKTGKSYTFNMIAWSDAQAAADKVKLAKDLGLRGVAFFKIDGSEGQDIWELF